MVVDNFIFRSCIEIGENSTLLNFGVCGLLLVPRGCTLAASISIMLQSNLTGAVILSTFRIAF